MQVERIKVQLWNFISTNRVCRVIFLHLFGMFVAFWTTGFLQSRCGGQSFWCVNIGNYDICSGIAKNTTHQENWSHLWSKSILCEKSAVEQDQRQNEAFKVTPDERCGEAGVKIFQIVEVHRCLILQCSTHSGQHKFLCPPCPLPAVLRETLDGTHTCLIRLFYFLSDQAKATCSTPNYPWVSLKDVSQDLNATIWDYVPDYKLTLVPQKSKLYEKNSRFILARNV